MGIAQKIITEMTALENKKASEHLSRFFKTGEGEYGEGDMFLGIRVPVTRSLVKKYKEKVNIEDLQELINSQWHEIRLAGFLLLAELYKRKLKSKDPKDLRNIVSFYLQNLDKGNNWDLVDLVAYNILGDYVVRNPQEKKVLKELSEMDGYLWRQRVAIVSTFSLIKKGDFELTFEIAKRYLDHKHDLVHKATGWMLREIGKRGGEKELKEFLGIYGKSMPRTMLRYAIEKFPEQERRRFLSGESDN